MPALKQSERLFALFARRGQELGRRLKRDEWFEVADRFFADLGKERSRAETHPDAEAIYASYPRKVGKVDALRAISRAIAGKGGDSVGIADATAAYGRAVETWPKAVRFKRGFDGVEFDTVPNPATWFNRGSFDDDRTQWPVYGPRAANAKEQAPESEPARWREYLAADMPDCVYLDDGWTWQKIDADLRAHIVGKMRAKGFL
jgi:hypothetical protein